MRDNKKILAIIPARGGSKRLPGKNIKNLGGKPLIAWTIEAAIESNLFDEIMVNTDSKEIAKEAQKFGASTPFIRPEKLASDTASSLDMVKHTLEYYKEQGSRFTTVILLQPTSPLRTSNDIINAYQLFDKKNATSVLSVCEVDHPTSWCNTLNKSLSMKGFIKPSISKNRSQDFDSEYRLNGAIYIWNVNTFLESNDTIIEPSFASIMPRERSIDIDEEIDFIIASALIDKLKHKNLNKF